MERGLTGRAVVALRSPVFVSHRPHDALALATVTRPSVSVRAKRDRAFWARVWCNQAMKSLYTDDQWQSIAQRYGIAQPPQLFRAAWTNVGLDLNKTAEFLAAGIVSPKAALDSTHGAASRAMAQRPEGAGPNDFEFTYEKRGNKVFFKARVSGARLRATYNTRTDTAEFCSTDGAQESPRTTSPRSRRRMAARSRGRTQTPGLMGGTIRTRTSRPSTLSWWPSRRSRARSSESEGGTEATSVCRDQGMLLITCPKANAAR
jgi:hypothetical protein